MRHRSNAPKRHKIRPLTGEQLEWLSTTLGVTCTNLDAIRRHLFRRGFDDSNKVMKQLQTAIASLLIAAGECNAKSGGRGRIPLNVLVPLDP
jgi:hypothetical protein